jgi:methionine sulfoxide reductase heme-binding subunit
MPTWWRICIREWTCGRTSEKDGGVVLSTRGAAKTGFGSRPGPSAGRKALLRALKPLTFTLALLPLLKIGINAFSGGLGANPIAEILNRLGYWTLVFLTLTLACTPAKILLRITWPLRIRRMLGLFTFFYAFLHFSTYLGVDKFFDLREVAADVTKRKFILVGFAAFCLLIPLAITSTNAMVKRLGYRRWKRLHRLVYVIAALGIIHFVWRVKADLRLPLRFAAIVGFLMAVRAGAWIRESVRSRATSPRAGPAARNDRSSSSSGRSDAAGQAAR